MYKVINQLHFEFKRLNQWECLYKNNYFYYRSESVIAI